MSINILSEEIINQIAAGEVIENPASVIKELIENSIDAGAKNIEINLEDYGFKKIVVEDDGIGISKEDLLLAPKRHATSKIKNFEDLYSIKTMGFRGEALASIFSVAKTTIISKKCNLNNLNSETTAYKISSENINEIIETSYKCGTKVIVEDLFYNTPVRKKYLDSEKKEYKKILDVIERYALVYNNITFKLVNNGKIEFFKPTFSSIEENIIYVLGKDLKDKLLNIDYSNNGIKITGFIGNPSVLTYSNARKNQYIFINNRYVKSKLIKDAVYEGFSTNLMEGRHPFYVLFIEIDPEIIDVNVHPTKIEVRFENELEIYTYIREAISEVFKKKEIFKPFEEKVKKDQNKKLNEIVSDINEENLIYSNDLKEIKNKYETKSYFTKTIQKELDLNKFDEDINSYDKNLINENFEKLEKKSNKDNYDLNKTNKISENDFGPLYETLKDYRILGQVNKTFIILETKTDMIIIDQHVAEEKFYYENLVERFKINNFSTQKLLTPKIFELTSKEMILYNIAEEFLKQIGFDVEKYGQREIIVRGVPIFIKGELLSPNMIKDILYELDLDNNFISVKEKMLDKLASISCKSSIKAGHELTNKEIENIVENLKKLKEPFNCPHGRPILLKWSFRDLEKKFKRIV